MGNSFVYIVDSSGSMTGSPFDRVKRELQQSINHLNANQQFHVVFFNSETIPMVGPNDRASLVLATDANRINVGRWISQQIPCSTTNPEGAIRLALEMKPSAIFLISDGVFDEPESARQAALVENHSSTVIHTIAFMSQEGEDTLHSIANDHGGTYRFIGDNYNSKHSSSGAKKDGFRVSTKNEVTAQPTDSQTHTVPSSPTTVSDYLKQALKKFEDGNIREVIIDSTAAIKIGGYESAFYKRSHNESEAIPCMAYLIRGWAYMQLGEKEEALSDFNKSISHGTWMKSKLASKSDFVEPRYMRVLALAYVSNSYAKSYRLDYYRGVDAYFDIRKEFRLRFSTILVAVENRPLQKSDWKHFLSNLPLDESVINAK